MGLMDALDEIELSGGKDLVRVKLADGVNKMRILTAGTPYAIHWDFPAGSERKASLPCLQSPVKDAPKVKCPFCELNAKNPKFFTRKVGLSFGVEQDGIAKMADFEQRGILDGLGKLEKDENWAAIVGGDLSNIEVAIERVNKNDRVSYTVGWFPGSGKLKADKLEELRAQVPNIKALHAAPDLSTEDGVKRMADLCAKVVMEVPPLTEEEQALLAAGKKLQKARK